MVLVEVRSPFYNEEEAKVEWRLIGRVHADGEKLSIEGDEAGIIDTGMPVMDMASGRKVEAGHDPEGWARNLPFAFRAGDIIAEVISDTAHASEVDEPLLEVDLPAIPEPGARRSRAASATG